MNPNEKKSGSVSKTIYEESLEYHSKGRKGKIEVVPTKAVSTQQDLSLAYSPGVAEPCRMIAEKEDNVFEYTARGNLIAVLSNGTAVLGLGDIGPYAAKPVMEGKGILFKKFADIDVFDIEINAKDPDDVIRFCEMLEPTVGGINLEDIKAPECFYIEETLRKKLRIPVFHDDQHGTAVISGAAFLNALEVTNKSIDKVRVVFSGGGAAAIACAKLYVSLGVKRENVVLCDSKGVITFGRKEGMNKYKEEFATKLPLKTLEEALVGADAFVGVSVKGALRAEWLKKMARDPIVFAMANPDPEILPEEVISVREDAIVATGRSDYPNQVNNVLGFPFIFRGALDTRATCINEDMKMAAVKALAALAKEDMPENVIRAYGGVKLKFGREYLIPKPFDRRALLWVATSVAKAAMDSGVSRIKLDLITYRERLETMLGTSYSVMRGIKKRVQSPHLLHQESKAGNQIDRLSKRAILVFPEGEHPKILRAAAMIREENIAEPVLLGDVKAIEAKIEELDLKRPLNGVKLIRPSQSEFYELYAKKFFDMRCRRGMTHIQAREMMKQVNVFGAMMVEAGNADGLVNGIAQSYPDVLRPALQVIGTKSGSPLAGIYMMVTPKRVLFFADATVNINPTAEELARIAIQTAKTAKGLMQLEPRVAMLSFSNFGSNNHELAKKVKDATQIAKRLAPDLIIDGEMQADTALVPEISTEHYPFNAVAGNANILIFPDLNSANIGYKLLARMGNVDAIGPILVGMNKPVTVLQHASDITDIVNMAALTVMEIQLQASTLSNVPK